MRSLQAIRDARWNPAGRAPGRPSGLNGHDDKTQVQIEAAIRRASFRHCLDIIREHGNSNHWVSYDV